MLTLTPSATAAVAALLDSPQVPHDAALRLQQGVDASGGTAIGLAVVSEPQAADTHVPVDPEHELLLAPEIAGLLDDQVLDAEMHDENVAFTIRPQAVDGRPPS